MENSAVAIGLEKVDWKKSVFIPLPKKGNAKECSNYHTIALISPTSKVMLKILQARLQQYMNRELPYVQAGFRKCRGWRRKWQPIPVFLPGKVHGQRSLASCSPWGYMTEHVCTRMEGDGLVAIKW